MGTSCFEKNWKNFNCWLTPPVSLVSKVLIHMERCKARGTLVIPKWESANFWPLLVNGDGKFKGFIKDYDEYVRPFNFFVNSSNVSRVFHKNFESNVLVLKICYQ